MNNLVFEFPEDEEESHYLQKMKIDSLYESRSSEYYTNMLGLIDAECYFSLGKPIIKSIKKTSNYNLKLIKCVATIETKNCYPEELIINVNVRNNSYDQQPIIVDLYPKEKCISKEITKTIELDANAEGNFQFVTPSFSRKSTVEIKEKEEKCTLKTYGLQSDNVKWKYNNSNHIDGDFVFYFIIKAYQESSIHINSRVIVKTKIFGKIEFILDEKLKRELSFDL